MEDLRTVMQVIDQNAHNLPEGDYLKLCNTMRKLYKDKTSQYLRTIVDYENFDIVTENESDDVLDHFHDYFYNESMMNEEYFIESQIEHLRRELLLNNPIKRVTKAIKERAITQYCDLHGIQLERYDEETLRKRMDEHGCDIGESGTKFDRGVRRLYKSYIAFENAYREVYRHGLHRKISELQGWLESLEEM
jgi:hypothetical protein